MRVLPDKGMANKLPLVSVGMVVYNAEPFIRESLESLSAQDYVNIEIVISDNASPDRTGDICREYAAHYDHIRYFRNPTNLGAVANSNRVLELTRGKYFMWASDHDLWHPSFISRCIAEFERHAEVVLVYPQTVLIDADRRHIKIMDDKLDMSGLSCLERYKYVIWNLRKCNMIYGLILKQALDMIGNVKNVLGPDHLVLAGLALQGSFVQLETPLFYRRQNRPDEAEPDRIKRVLEALDPTTAAERNQKARLDLWRELRNAHLKILFHAPLRFSEKLEAAIDTLRCFQERFGVPTRFTTLSKLVQSCLTRKKGHKSLGKR